MILHQFRIVACSTYTFFFGSANSDSRASAKEGRSDSLPSRKGYLTPHGCRKNGDALGIRETSRAEEKLDKVKHWCWKLRPPVVGHRMPHRSGPNEP